MMTIRVEYVGGPRDGMVAEYDLLDFTDKLMYPVDPADNRDDCLLPGTLVYAWEGPTEVPPAGQHLKCRYLGEMVFEGPGE